MCDSENDLLNKHRKEKKDLQSKIQALKKTASKGDKKKKKEVQEEILQLENELIKRHSEEIDLLNSSFKNIEISTVDKKDNKNDEDEILGNKRVSKAQRRRDKRAIEESERAAEILAQEELNKTGPRQLEIDTLQKLLSARNLVLQLIPSDGDCLYNAIKHQQEINGCKVLSTKQLRILTADYITKNKELLINYMINPVSNENLTNEEFQEYCDLIRNTSAWGGQIEIKALSNVLKTPIEVIQASGQITQNDEDYRGPNFIITYHRFMYSLGEHYNSTIPKSMITESDNEDLL